MKTIFMVTKISQNIKNEVIGIFDDLKEAEAVKYFFENLKVNLDIYDSYKSVEYQIGHKYSIEKMNFYTTRDKYVENMKQQHDERSKQILELKQKELEASNKRKEMQNNTKLTWELKYHEPFLPDAGSSL